MNEEIKIQIQRLLAKGLSPREILSIKLMEDNSVTIEDICNVIVEIYTRPIDKELIRRKTIEGLEEAIKEYSLFIYEEQKKQQKDTRAIIEAINKKTELQLKILELAEKSRHRPKEIEEFTKQ